MEVTPVGIAEVVDLTRRSWWHRLAGRANGPVASASAAPPPMAAAAPAPSSNEGAASATNYPWPEPPSAKQ